MICALAGVNPLRVFLITRNFARAAQIVNYNGTKDTKFGMMIFRNLRALRDLHGDSILSYSALSKNLDRVFEIASVPFKSLPRHQLLMANVGRNFVGQDRIT